MHAVVFEVDMKDGWREKAGDELDALLQGLRQVPSFTRGIWTADGTAGLSLVLFDSLEAAQEVADKAWVPPDASCVLRSARVTEVIRDAGRES